MKLFRTGCAALASAALALTLCALPATEARAETSEELQQRVNDAYAQLQSYTAELELASGQLQNVTDELEQTRAQIEQTEQDISEKEQEIAEGQQAIADRISDTYKHGGTTLVDVVLGSSNFEELFSNILYANRIADYDAQLVEEVKTARDELAQKKAELAEQEQTQQQLVTDQQARVNDVNARVAQQQSYYEGLDDELKEQLANEEAQRIAQEAAQAQAQQQEQQSNQGTSGNNGGSSNGGSSSGGGSSASSNGNTNSGNAPSSVVDVALAQRGKPYVWGAGGPDSFDCSGLTSYAYAQVGYSIPHQSQSQYNLVAGKGHLVYNIGSLKPGDLVFWGTGGSGSAIYHVGLYIGGGQYVHASMPGVGVVVSTLSTGGNYVGGGSPV